MDAIERFAELGFYGDPEDEIPCSNNVQEEEIIDMWEDKKSAKREVNPDEFKFQPDAFESATALILPTMKKLTDSMTKLAEQIDSDGLTVVNESKVCSRIAYIIISLYEILELFPDSEKILDIDKHEIEAYRKAALAYAVNKSEFNILFENNYTKVSVPKFHSNHSPRKYKQVRYFYYHDNLMGLFEKHGDKIPYFSHASIVVDSPGMIDNDNLELQHFINSLKGYFISSDEGYRLDVHLICSGRLTDTNEIYIMDKACYPNFVAENLNLFLPANNVKK